eukprot:CAMPEP_0179979040 /NCGR_PEP_ID=MMETSP0983-20121128/41095_1 /TAXON_ID=483367 /ORGANISM="non described non described, Strain CCMP 2436" /LENGTH=51 /DNA_ID=CAMNT_0021896697 /DNA_START=27 /DNA_END=179 /DNA_ORIENTATION=+
MTRVRAAPAPRASPIAPPLPTAPPTAFERQCRQPPLPCVLPRSPNQRGAGD